MNIARTAQRLLRRLRRRPDPAPDPVPDGRHLLLTGQPWGPPYYAISDGPAGRELQWTVRADVPLMTGEVAPTIPETVARVRRRRPDLPPYRRQESQP